MDTFKRYLWELLPRPYKVFEGAGEQRDPPEIKKWVEGVGTELDSTQELVYRLRRLWSVLAAPSEILDVIGYDRSLPRWDDEPDEEYRLRLLAAFDWFAMGGTVPGLKKILHRLGFPDVRIAERITSERWAEFSVDLKVTEGLLTESRVGRIRRSIEEIKAAHTILARLTIWMENEAQCRLYHGTATFRSGLHEIRPEYPELNDTYLTVGIATARGGYARVELSRSSGTRTAAFSGIATVQTHYVTIGPAGARQEE